MQAEHFRLSGIEATGFTPAWLAALCCPVCPLLCNMTHPPSPSILPQAPVTACMHACLLPPCTPHPHSPSPGAGISLIACAAALASLHHTPRPVD